METSDGLVPQSLGERMKTYEKEEYIDNQNAWLVRLDGKTFSSFTSQFEKPFDTRFTKAMVLTLNQMMLFLNPSCGFVCSDEITLVFPPIYGKMTEHYSSGRKNKIATVCAGKCSTYFILNLMKILKDENNEAMLNYVINSAPCFDARIIEIPANNLVEVCNNLLWRSLYDCRRNTVSSYGRHLLGKKGTQNKNGTQMIELMKEKGFDFDSLEIYKVYGVYAKFKEVPFKNEHGEFTRNTVFNFECIIKASQQMTDFVLNPKSLSPDELKAASTDLSLTEIFL